MLQVVLKAEDTACLQQLPVRFKVHYVVWYDHVSAQRCKSFFAM